MKNIFIKGVELFEEYIACEAERDVEVMKLQMSIPHDIPKNFNTTELTRKSRELHDRIDKKKENIKEQLRSLTNEKTYKDRKARTHRMG